MEHKQTNENTFIIRLEKGERVIETLTRFCMKNNINVGYLFGIGALSKVELAHYNLNNKEYSSKKINEQVEVCSFVGNIAMLDNKPFLHIHVVVADNKMQTYAGHLKEGIVSATLEVVLTKLNVRLERKYNEEIGLNLLDI